MKVFLFLLPVVALFLMPFRAPLPFRAPPAPPLPSPPPPLPLPPVPSPAPAPLYDNFLLVKTWIPTFCKRPSIGCNPVYLSQSFTLHGLWPADANGNTITRCSNTQEDKDIQREITALRTQLHQVWPSIRTGITDDIFWQHEWNEHGICSLTGMTKMTYFESVIRKTGAFNLLDILKNADVNPTYDIAYTKSNFQNAVKNSPQIGKNVYVSCRPFNTSHVLLEEILICLDNTATGYIDCPPNPSFRGCPVSRKIIIFPPN